MTMLTSSRDMKRATRQTANARHRRGSPDPSGRPSAGTWLGAEPVGWVAVTVHGPRDPPGSRESIEGGPQLLSPEEYRAGVSVVV